MAAVAMAGVGTLEAFPAMGCRGVVAPVGLDVYRGGRRLPGL